MQRKHVLAVGLAAGLLLLGARVALAGWPWSSSEPKKTTAPKPSRTVNKKEPSALDKITGGTKKFFSDVGDTLTLKKKTTTKKKPVTGYSTWNTPPQPEKKSWFGSTSQPKEPETPRSPSDFVNQKRVDW